MFAHWCHPNVISMKCIWKYSLYQHPPPQRGSTERSCSNASASSERGGGRRQQGSAVRGTRLVCFLHTYQQVRAEPEPLRIKGLVTVTAGGGFRNHKLNLQVMIWPSGIHRSPINLLAPPLTPGEGHKKIIIILKKKKKEITVILLQRHPQTQCNQKKMLHLHQGILQIIYPEFLTEKICIKQS